MQQDQPQIGQQLLAETEEFQQQPHREEQTHQEAESYQPEEQQAEEENHPQQPLQGQGAQQQGEPQLPPGPFEDQNEELEPEPEEQVQPAEEEADSHQVEQEQPVEQQAAELAEEGRSSNGPPEYNPDLIDDQEQEAATHPLIQDTQRLPEQDEFYMGEELIEPEGPSEVSHVYAQQEEIEWRDQEEPISSPYDYHFQGIHEEEAIEHQPALLSTAAQVGSSLMRLEPLPAQAVQTVEEKPKPETVEQSASTDPPPKTVPAATQASKVETQEKTDLLSKAAKPEPAKSQVKPVLSKVTKTQQVKSSLKLTSPKESQLHPEQKPRRENVTQSKVASVQAPKSVQALKKPENIKQSDVKAVPKTPSEQPSPKKEAENSIQEKKFTQAKEQINEKTTPKKDNPSSLLILRNQKQAEREQQAERLKIEQEQAKKNELKQQLRLAKIEKEREEQQRERKEVEKAENERRQKQREVMEQNQRQRERIQKERKDKQERQRLAKEQEQMLNQKEQQRQKQQQNLHAQNVSHVSKASMDRNEPQQASSSLPPSTIAKKKKKKKVSKQPQNKPAVLPDAPQSPPTAPASSNPPARDNESEHDHVSVAHSDIGQEEPRAVRNMVSQILMAEGGKPDKEGVVPVVLTSLMVVREAEKQRVGTTFRMFLKYNYEYERTVTAYKRIIVNVASQLQRKKAQKRPLQRALEDYFQDFAKIAKEFNDRCYKLQVQSAGEIPSKNPLASLRLQLKKGFDQMVFLRKSVANHNNRLALYVNNTLLPQLHKAFEGYYAGIVAEETKQTARRDQLVRKEKQLAKAIAQAQRSFQRGLEGRFKEDLFIELSKFINQEKIHRATLRNYGRGLLDLRQAYIRSEKELFDRLQQQLLRFKQEWWAAYGERRVWREAEGLGERIKEATRFADLCTLVDLDYIKYVLELQSKQERQRFGSRDFENYLDLVFFDRVVGNIRDMLKGATNKSFPLRAQGDELIHSISGNLVVFHRPLDLCRDHFRISNLNAKVVANGTVQFDELQKGILFDDSRTVRLQLKDEDRAEELICYLNEKEDDIVLPS